MNKNSYIFSEKRRFEELEETVEDLKQVVDTLQKKMRLMEKD